MQNFVNFFPSQIHKVPGFLTLLLQVVMSNDVQIPVRQSGRQQLSLIAKQLKFTCSMMYVLI